MRVYLVSLSILLSVLACKGNSLAKNSNPAGDNETIKKAKNLVEHKKYYSAFQLLEEADTGNAKPDIVLLKEDILLNYFVTSISHQMFSLMDIKEDENIEDYRGKEGTSSMVVFEPDKILNKLIKKYPTNYKLYEGLGDFYESAHNHYGSNWLIGEDSLNDLIRNNYQMAIDHDAADYHAYFRVAVYLIQDDKAYRKAITYLLKSHTMNKDYTDATYNLGYAYLLCDSRDTAIMYAKIADDEYKDLSLKGDAERMIGEIYGEKNDTANSVRYYEMANRTDTGNYYNIKSLLNIYVVTHNPKRKELLKTFFALGPGNPTIYNDLYQIYSDSIQGFEVIAFYKAQIPLYTGNDKVQGSLYFYLARTYLSYDKKIAKDYCLKAKETFTKIFDKDNGVFAAIDKLIEYADGKEDK